MKQKQQKIDDPQNKNNSDSIGSDEAREAHIRSLALEVYDRDGEVSKEKKKANEQKEKWKKNRLSGTTGNKGRSRKWGGSSTR